MKLIRSLMAAAVLGSIATPAFAQFDRFATTSTDNLKLLSSGPFSPYGTYTGQLLLAPGQPVIDMWCDDFIHNYSNGNVLITRYDATAAQLNQRTRFGAANLNNYKKAAYLTQFFAGLNNITQVQTLNYTIWHLFTPAQPNTVLPGEAAFLALLNNGPNNWQAINPSYWFIMAHPDPRTGGINNQQELLTMVAPEPSAIILVSTGLLGMVGLAQVRRRNKKS